MKQDVVDMSWIAYDITRTKHDHVLSTILDDGTNKLRVYVRRNSYAAQSYGRVEVWRDQWILVHLIEGLALASINTSFYDVEAMTEALKVDRDRLLEIAWAVLEGGDKE